MSRNSLFFVLGGVFCLTAVMGFFYISNKSVYPEERKLSGVAWSEAEYTSFFSNLAEKKGSAYAFEILRRIELSSGVNAHAVAHGIGYVLFEEKGISGIYDCTEEFRSACAHAIVIQALNKGGQSGIEEVIRACKNAPGGKGAYAICFHGVGHGLVASGGYDFESAVSQCAGMPRAPVDAYPGHRFTDAGEECIGGAVMEMLQGDHDKGEWEKAVARYLPVEDPFRPCTDEYVPVSLRSSCLLSLTQRFFGFAGISEEIPPPETYAEAMAVCAQALRESDKIECYGGFGKEFVFYGTQFDGNDANSLSDKTLLDIQSWCAYAKSSVGISRCLSVAADTLFWAGQNDPRLAVRFCSIAPESSRSECFSGLVDNVRYFLEEKKLREVCGLLPPEFLADCMPSASPVSVLLLQAPDFGIMPV